MIRKKVVISSVIAMVLGGWSSAWAQCSAEISGTDNDFRTVQATINALQCDDPELLLHAGTQIVNLDDDYFLGLSPAGNHRSLKISALEGKERPFLMNLSQSLRQGVIVANGKQLVVEGVDAYNFTNLPSSAAISISNVGDDTLSRLDNVIAVGEAGVTVNNTDGMVLIRNSSLYGTGQYSILGGAINTFNSSSIIVEGSYLEGASGGAAATFRRGSVAEISANSYLVAADAPESYGIRIEQETVVTASDSVVVARDGQFVSNDGTYNESNMTYVPY